MKLSLNGAWELLVRHTHPASLRRDADIDMPAGFLPRAAGGEYVKPKLNQPLPRSQSVSAVQQVVRHNIEAVSARWISELRSGDAGLSVH